MKGSAHLSADQLYLIAEALRLGPEERDFLQLLLEAERTAVDSRRRQLRAKIRAIGAAKADSTAHLSAKQAVVSLSAPGEATLAEYYLGPYLQIIHIAISVDFYGDNPASLASELGLSGGHAHTFLTTLERLGLAYREAKGQRRWRAHEPSLHLPKASPLYRAWRNQTKLITAQRPNHVEADDTYAFSTVFSADLATRKFIHERFLEFLTACEEAVAAAPARQVLQMSFDLLPWTTLR